MRNFYFMLLLVGCIFISCSDESKNENIEFPISDLKLPAGENEWRVGDIITVEGRGFKEECKIWFKSVSTKDEVQAEITLITSIGISFKAPEVYGEQELILKQDGKEYVLGKLIFEKDNGEEEQVKLITRIVSTQGIKVFEDVFEYDDLNRIIKITMTDHDNDTNFHFFEYKDGEIIIEYWDYDVEEPDLYTCKQNSEGLVVKQIENRPGWEEDISVYEYSNNKLSKISGERAHYYIINWSAHNIVRIDSYYDGEKQEDATYSFSYYSEFENELNLDFSILLGDFDALLSEYIFEQGYLGQRNKNLLKNYSYKERTYSFEYEFKENCIIVNVYSISQEKEPRLIEVMEIFYE